MSGHVVLKAEMEGPHEVNGRPRRKQYYCWLGADKPWHTKREDAYEYSPFAAQEIRLDILRRAKKYFTEVMIVNIELIEVL